GLTQAYIDLTGKLGARVAPVGATWEKALQDDPKLVLHSKDKSHPTKTGTYLAACVFYGVLYERSPRGLPGKIGGLDAAEAARLQAVAWKMVQEDAKGH